MGILYVVATPIGNLEDITLRALKTLYSADVVVTEDIAKTKHLLEKYHNEFNSDVGKHKQSFIVINDFKEEEVVPQILSLLTQEKSVALVSEAGTPLISDPGFKLVREALRLNISVVPIPGASAPIAALSASGLPSDKFLFLGFLPKKENEKQKLFESVKTTFMNLEAKHVPTIIFFESPHRLIETLQIMNTVFSDIEIVVARELTKLYEEITKNNITFFMKTYEDQKPRGEFTILFSLKIKQLHI